MSMNQATSNSTGWNAWRPALLAALAGLIVFSLLVDPLIIDPLRAGWLATGDTAQSYLGWLFFRQEPWTLPLGAAHKLGMEQANSIVYSDAIPLLAITFKIFRAWLPSGFQYGGLWLFGCYALQGYFACRLLMLFTSRGSVLIGGVLLFLLSPIMLLRSQEHLALTAHWIVLAAIYLYYAPPESRRLLHWLVLLWLSPWVHAYLMCMAYAVWAAYLLRHGLLDRCWSLGRLTAMAVFAVAGSLSMMWLAGYFGEMEVSTGGFGYYSMNLLAPFVPIGAGPFLIHAPAAATTGQYEGFNYLGLGVLLALVVATARAIAGHRLRSAVSSPGWRKAPDLALVLCCLVLTVLALSNVVTLGSHQLFTVVMTPAIEGALNVFRASGRLFWPVYYMLLLAAMRGAARLSGPTCGRLLVLVLTLQLVDFWPFLHTVHAVSARKVEQDRFPVFGSPFWEKAKARYANIYVIPGVYEDDRSVAYESLAGDHGFAIDSAYYARMPSVERLQPRQQRHALFLQGEPDPHGLYLIQRSALAEFKSTQRLLPSATGIGQVDGFIVVAPDWFADGATEYLQHPTRSDFPAAAFDEDIRFGKNDRGLVYMLAGWSDPGPDAVWSEGLAATLVFQVPLSSGDVQVSLNVLPYLPAAYPRLGVDVQMDGQLLAHWEFVRGQPGPVTVLTIPATLRAADDGNIALKFRFDQPRSPLQSGESVDARRLALQLRNMRLQSH
jgi:hypothetical protein